MTGLSVGLLENLAVGIRVEENHWRQGLTRAGSSGRAQLRRRRQVRWIRVGNCGAH